MRGSSRTLFFAVLLLFLAAVGEKCLSQNPDPEAPAKYGWGFRNYSEKEYSWDVYCHSFFGVPLDSTGAWTTATFDKAFYELAFKTKLPDPAGTGDGAGSCFGLAILSLMMNKFGGYYGYCAPPKYYTGDTVYAGATGPIDPALRRIVAIMMGRQLSLAALEAYLDQALGGHSQNCNYGFKLAQQAIAKEGPCLISITNAANPADGSGGHTMIAYGTTDDGSGNARIWIVDSNRLWTVPTSRDYGWYAADSNYVTCNLSTGKWSFRMSNGSVFPSSNGNIIILSPSMVGPPGRVPSSLGLALGELLNKLLLTN